METQIDLTFLPFVLPVRWGVVQGPNNSPVYIHTSKSNSKARRVKTYLHRYVCGLEFGDGLHVHHRFGDSLDNRRSQLIVMTAKEHSDYEAECSYLWKQHLKKLAA